MWYSIPQMWIKTIRTFLLLILQQDIPPLKSDVQYCLLRYPSRWTYGASEDKITSSVRIFWKEKSSLCKSEFFKPKFYILKTVPQSVIHLIEHDIGSSFDYATSCLDVSLKRIHSVILILCWHDRLKCHLEKYGLTLTTILRGSPSEYGGHTDVAGRIQRDWALWPVLGELKTCPWQ